MRGLERTLHNASSQICVTYLCLRVLRVRYKKKRGQWKRKRGRMRFGKRIVEVEVEVEVCLQTAFLFEAPATVAVPSKLINVLTNFAGFTSHSRNRPSLPLELHQKH